jgi:capsid protein
VGFTRDQGGVNIYSQGVEIDKRSRRSKYLVKGWGLTRDLGGVNIYSQGVEIDKRSRRSKYLVKG